LTRPYHSTVESFGHDLTPLAVGANSAVLFDILHTIYDTRYMRYVQTIFDTLRTYYIIR